MNTIKEHSRDYSKLLIFNISRNTWDDYIYLNKEFWNIFRKEQIINIVSNYYNFKNLILPISNYSYFSRAI